MLGSMFAVFGLFNRDSPEKLKAKKEDIEITIRQKKRELHDMENLIGEMKRKAEAAIRIDEHIEDQQKRLDELGTLAAKKLDEFRNVEKTFSERKEKAVQSEIHEKQTKVLLNKKIDLLEKKEESLETRESASERKVKHAMQLRAEQKRADRQLAHKHERIQARITAGENRLAALISASVAAHKDLVSLNKQVNKFEAESKIIAHNREILRNQALAIEKKANWVKDHEKSLSDRSADMLKRVRALETAKDVIANAMQMKRETELGIKDKKRYAEEVMRLIAENNKRLDVLKAAEKKTASLNNDTKKREKNILDKAAVIDRKEKAVLKREMDWLQHQKALQDLSDALVNEKKDLANWVLESKADLANLKQEWDDRIEALRDEKKFLSTQKSEIHRLVQSDIIALKEKEQELKQAVKEYTTDQKQLEKEERAVIARVNVLTRKSKAVRARETKIIAQESTAKKILAAAEKAKALKIDVPKLKREYKSLRSEIRKLEHTGVKHSELRLRVAEEKPPIELVEKPVPKKVHKKKHSKIDDIHSMIENARSSVESGNVNAALDILDDLQHAARKMKEADRRHLDYEIRDLRTSIKLASL